MSPKNHYEKVVAFAQDVMESADVTSESKRN